MSANKPEKNERYSRVKEAFDDASDTEIAKRLNVTKAAVSQWKKGQGGPSDATLIRVSRVTGKPLEWLITGDPKWFEMADDMRVYNGPEHRRLAKVIESEFQRVAKEEGVEMATLVEDVARHIGIPPRYIYMYRIGKWSVPASIVPLLSERLKSTAILKAILGGHVEAAMEPLLRGLEASLKSGKGSLAKQKRKS